eukprot:gene20953-27156_t
MIWGCYLLAHWRQKSSTLAYRWGVLDYEVDETIRPQYKGVNATILCYGQTGSGKTFTMGGTIDLTNENNNGIMSLAIQSIFNKKKSYESNGCIVTLSLSYIEVYMEECYDLLTDRNKLELHEVLNGEIVLDGLTKYPIDDMINISNYLLNASKYRMTSGTAMNAHSSRSHSICTIYLNVMNTTNSSTLADHLRNELLESKKRSTQLMKKMKDEGQNYLAEKLKLQHAEIQSQKREKKAISLLTGLKNDYLLREKVLKGQIEAKERENKQLKELIEKQSKVRSMKTKDPVNNPFNFVNNYVNPISAISTANLPTTNISTNVTSSQEMGKLNELKNSLISEIDRYMYQSNLQDHLQNQIDLRHATMKRLRDFKSATFCNPTDIINIE